MLLPSSSLSDGALALQRVAKRLSYAQISRHCQCSPRTVAGNAKGDFRPRAKLRDAYATMYGIPEESWDPPKLSPAEQLSAQLARDIVLAHQRFNAGLARLTTPNPNSAQTAPETIPQ